MRKSRRQVDMSNWLLLTDEGREGLVQVEGSVLSNYTQLNQYTLTVTFLRVIAT